MVTLIYKGTGGQAYAFVTASGLFCVAGVDPPGTTEYGSMGCGSASDAATYGGSWSRGGIGPRHSNTIVLLVPNGVKLAYVHTGPASRVILLVAHNVASWTAVTPLTASFNNTAGHTITGPTIRYAPQRLPTHAAAPA